MAQDCQIDISLLNEIFNKHSMRWLFFFKEKFISSINKCNNSSTSSPNKLLWRYLKCIVKDNTCLEIGYWPNHFKILTSIIIPKPNKESYDSPKVFRPIVLLNTIEKLIKKFIGERLQFHLISNNFIHLS